jgi:hypothetical protein
MGVVDAELWQTVQDRLAAGRRERSMAVGAEEPSLLAGLVFDSDHARLSPTHAVKKGKRYRYYVSTALITGRRCEHLKGRRIPAGDIEGWCSTVCVRSSRLTRKSATSRPARP